MNKITRSRTATFVAIGLFTILCGAWAIAPLWVNPCIPTHLSEQEVEQMVALPNYKNLTVEEKAKSINYYREAEIPCGAQDLPTNEKLQASRFQGMILGELRGLRSIILRFELVGTSDPPGTYSFKGYTFFFIPVLDGSGGGSGYMKIIPFPFLYGDE